MSKKKFIAPIHNCPNCNSTRVNFIKPKYFCKNCNIEFDEDGKMYTIQWDGELVPYYENEFANIV